MLNRKIFIGAFIAVVVVVITLLVIVLYAQYTNDNRARSDEYTDQISGEVVPTKSTGGATGDKILILGVSLLTKEAVQDSDIDFIKEYISFVAINKFGKKITDTVSIQKGSVQFSIGNNTNSTTYKFNVYLDNSHYIIVKLITPLDLSAGYGSEKKVLLFETTDGKNIAEYKKFS